VSALPLPLPGIAVRDAVLADVPALERLMAPYVATGDLLPRSNYDLCRHIKEYAVATVPGGELVGCGSLKIYSRGLAEVAGLAVHPRWQGAGVGRALVETLAAEARAQGIFWLGAIWFVAAYAIVSLSMTKFHHYVLPAVPGLSTKCALFASTSATLTFFHPGVRALLSAWRIPSAVRASCPP
jgi:N-acetylglutamate synthase-like GNAT family acetyltransferase